MNIPDPGSVAAMFRSLSDRMSLAYQTVELLPIVPRLTMSVRSGTRVTTRRDSATACIVIFGDWVATQHQLADGPLIQSRFYLLRT